MSWKYKFRANLVLLGKTVNKETKKKRVVNEGENQIPFDKVPSFCDGSEQWRTNTYPSMTYITDCSAFGLKFVTTKPA
jgi:hypothetical protein